MKLINPARLGLDNHRLAGDGLARHFQLELKIEQGLQAHAKRVRQDRLGLPKVIELRAWCHNINELYPVECY